MAHSGTADGATSLTRPHWSVARSWLLLPGRPDSFDEFDAARNSAVDVLVLDIEDGLPAPLKNDGRRCVASWLGAGNRAWVRIGGITSDTWAADLEAVGFAPGLDGVVLAKTESPADVAATAAHLPPGTPVVALIESALGIESAFDIARHSSCARLAFGIGDFRMDTGMSADPTTLAYPRGRLVIASRATGLPAPIDGPTLRVNAADLDRDSQIARSTGMSGRLCLAAEHAQAINTLLSPSPAEIAAARETVVRLSDAANVYDGSAKPTLARAEATLALAGKLGLTTTE